jgi:ketosteroid isomerase-like protein
MNGKLVGRNLLLLVLLAFGSPAGASARQRTASRTPVPSPAPDSRLTGVFRLNPELSDRLYSAVSSASSRVPFAEQQRFFIDLTERLTPPDQLAIRRRGSLVEIASSRAPRTAFNADGRERVLKTAGGTARERTSVSGDSLVLVSERGGGEGYRVTFTSIDGGSRLRVTRRISFKELDQPVVIHSVYERISNVARWEIYGEPGGELAAVSSVMGAEAGRPAGAQAEAADAEALRAELGRWVNATNEKDIRGQMEFYMPTLLAYYLTRNTPRELVRAEKARVFARATAIDIRAEEPEIIFIERTGAAVMHFRKRYRIEGGPRGGSGEVIQELRWRKTDGGWKIYSERDIRVIR